MSRTEDPLSLAGSGAAASDRWPRLRCPGCGGPRPLGVAPLPPKPRSPPPLPPTAATTTPQTSGPPPLCSSLPSCPACGHDLRSEDGVLLLDELPGASDYPEGLHALDRAIEDDHWWYASRNRVLASELSPLISRMGLRTLLEVGCGTGFVLRMFRQLGLAVVGLEMSLPGLVLARERLDVPLLRSGSESLPLADPVDIVALVDVLEHADEGPLLAACVQALRPGGLLLLSVPARPSLWSLEDRLVGHRRRYTRSSLGAALDRSGLELLRLRPFHSLVTVLACVARRGRTADGPLPADPLEALALRRQQPSPWKGRVMRAACATEGLLGHRVPLPFESHLLAIARRPN